MTLFQKILSLVLITGMILLSYQTFTQKPKTPQNILEQFALSARKVLYDMQKSDIPAAQHQTQITLKIIRHGILLFPDQLDLRLGEIHFCQMIGDTACMINGIAGTLEQAQINNHHWQWRQNEQRGKKFMLSSFQTFQKNLWLAKEDAAFQKTAELILSYYPDNIMNLDNLGVLFLEQKNFSKAKEFLERAHLLAPRDTDIATHLKQLPENQKKKISSKSRKKAVLKNKKRHKK